jgi:hypothetical protein
MVLFQEMIKTSQRMFLLMRDLWISSDFPLVFWPFSFLTWVLIAAMADTKMNLASPMQLDIIDGLRGLGISNYVALPQVSDASSLKFLADT